MGTLADLVGGFQGGYSGVQDARRKRKINKAIDYDLGSMEEGRRGRKAGMKRLGYDMSADFTMPPTYGERLVGKIKGMFGGSTGQQSTTAIDPAASPAGPMGPPAPAAAARPETYDVGNLENRYSQPNRYADGGAVRKFANGGTALPTAPGQLQPQNMGDVGIPTPNRQMMAGQQGGALPGFADGGAAEKSYGDYWLTEEEANELEVKPGSGMSGAKYRRGVAGPQEVPIDGGGRGALWEDVKRNAADVFDDTIKGALGGQKVIDEADAKLDKAEGAREVGHAVRETGSAALTSAGETTAGLLKDVFIDNPITQGALGFFGYGNDGEGSDKEAAVTAAVNPDEPVGPEQTASQPGADAPNTQTPQAKNAAQPAGPDDEIVDMSQVRSIDPEDMPNQSVKDWEDERRFWAAQAIALGNDPHEAMKAVDARQMRGFNQYGQQAFQLLQNGDATGAARALYAAYQYFPNGADVRFGIQKGVNGQPVLVGMGKTEDGDEPIGDPMVITPESLSAQLENMSNPSAFRNWTKDWRTMEQELREYNEVTKKTAEANAQYRDRMGRAGLNNSEAAYLRAATGGGALDQGDLDRANAAFQKAVELEGFENQAQADAMMDMMSQIYSQHAGNIQYPTVIRDVRDAIRSRDFSELDQKYGQ